jgi:hypothetical protein
LPEVKEPVFHFLEEVEEQQVLEVVQLMEVLEDQEEGLIYLEF